MIGSDLNRVKKVAISSFRKALGENLLAVILAGSVARGEYIEGWSDIDLVLVLAHASIHSKRVISKVIREREGASKIHHGINIVLRSEILSPKFPVASLDGKVLQALLELKKDPSRLQYSRAMRVERFYFPDKGTIKEYSLQNIGMFFRKNRKDSTAMRSFSQADLKDILKKEIRAYLTILKLAIQTRDDFLEDRDILNQAKRLFPSYDFEDFSFIYAVIGEWSSLRGKQKTQDLIVRADRFIERFSTHVFHMTNARKS